MTVKINDQLGQGEGGHEIGEKEKENLKKWWRPKEYSTKTKTNQKLSCNISFGKERL